MNKAPVDTLKNIYRLYDAQLESVDTACQKFCSDCCTTNVTMTGLEGHLMIESPFKEQIMDVLSRVDADAPARYRPARTTNNYVELCRTAVEPDEDHPEGQAGVCPFLDNGACTVYPVRPFGCRCMISKRPCADYGFAEIDDFTLTLNTVFLQFIEHLDRNGFSGNMRDVLGRLEAGSGKVPDGFQTIPNRSIPALMIPPDHRTRMADVVNRLSRLVEGL